ncbi:MAG: primosomal protein N' [Acidaminococcus sp.]|jgi:primosomal protein N' (replication factor Y)|nr:primosomal protein N' [Acidaminococcus sp.]MCI2100468.1 primosomal protein N' [Acidaminococcus sp.]MCI2114789.1 primosomal protein N' [Acidaminococcus sp.]MCI2116842.1 primosomal protein N' [Acidaminococcus sp.]
MKYAKVAINLPAKNLFRQFTYRVPETLDFLGEGWRVVVPFGRQMLEGFIVEEDRNVDLSLDIKDIADVIGTQPWFDAEMLATAHWLSQYYLCSLAEALRLFIPGKRTVAAIGRYRAVPDKEGPLTESERALYTYIAIKGPKTRKEIARLDEGEKALKGLITKQFVSLDYEVTYKIKEKWERTVKILPEGYKALQEGGIRGKSQKAALSLLQNGEETSARDVEKQGISAAVLHSLIQKGWLAEGKRRVLRDSYDDWQGTKETMTLTEEQQAAVDAVEAERQKHRFRTFLLRGVTGSGKTEVYLRLTDKVLRAGGQVMVLVPEIALTGQIVKRFKAWFGDIVAVAHSRLSASERADVWERMRSGSARVLIGVRSAVFCSFHKLGLIILDEEHEGTYKQEERPGYHARLVAQVRASHYQIPVVLGSATPDLESYEMTRQGRYTELVMTHRAHSGSHLPQVSIVDMREELQHGNRSVFSDELREALETTIKNGEQAIILLNRRGFSTFVMCRDCGESIQCPNCAVSLVYHAKQQMLVCHYCGHTEPVPTVCPKCGSKRIRFFGTGTEKAEAEIAALCEGVKPLRMDQDSTARKFSHEKILRAFRSQEYNVLLGTQMVAKGHDIPNVTLVGILSADSQLNLPDFRSGERCFALLTQAAGRAGRGTKPGRVIFQAYDADNPILKLAADQDYVTFAAQELEQRKQLHYPPFTMLLKVVVTGKNQEEALETAQRVVNGLQAWQLETKYELEILGPFPAIVPVINHIWRVNILLKSRSMKPVKDWIRKSEFINLPNVYFDVDPISVI